MKGYISGVVDGDFNGTIRGTINAALETNAVEQTEEAQTDESNR